MPSTPKGSLEKATWNEVRDEVAKVNPTFAKIIDDLNPSDKYWVARVKYPYGSQVMKRSILSLPNAEGDIVPITDPSISNDIREGIGYNLNSNPVSLVLNNSFEIYLPFEDRTIPLDGLLTPGSAFGAWRILNPEGTQQPVFIWDMTAGARSTFMLTKIGETRKHMRLKKKYALSKDTPTNYIDHWEVMKEIANHPDFSQPWEAEILYFSKQWFEHLDDKAWHDFYYYFHRSIWRGTEFWRNQPIWNLIFSLILNEYKSPMSAYIMDTVKYLIHIGIGALPGLAPARNSIAGPFKGIQEVYSNEYKLNHPPVIIQPSIFDMNDPKCPPIYYSLQFPNAIEFKPSSRQQKSIISDLHQVRSLLKRYEHVLLSDTFNIGGTPIAELFKLAQYDYFHSAVELHEGMRDSSEMREDKYLRTTLDGVEHEDFPDNCLFGKGCIRISRK